MATPDVRLEIAPYDYAAAERLARELGVPEAVAQVLVRRGYADPAAARAFLAASDEHPLDAFGGLREAARRIIEHVERGSRITVHGDYDADGVCSTAILVRALTTLGADVDWYLPSRTEDGYGLSAATVERLAARGTDLLVTADCAITAVDEIAAARAAGLDVVVTDHHAPRADGVLPDAPIVHPRLAGYPCPDLCAAGVAYKLAAALLDGSGMDGGLADADLDLVALATVADVVPLVGENRRLVRAGLRALAMTRKPGLQALMDVSGTDPGLLDAGAVAFRLAPRINAAGRLRRADAALELVLTHDDARARAIAAELDGCNAERQEVEARIRWEAEAQLADLPADRPAYVLAGERWHPGVVGIVAARIAERHHRPTVLIALDGDGGTGSGRSIPRFDLLAGLQAGAAHLQRFGGHRAAAGLTIAREDVPAFREAFTEHAAAVLAPEELVPAERIDAVAGGESLGLGLAEALEELGPFGAGNPAVTLLVPAAHLDDPRPMGEGRHVAFTITAGGARSRAVCFGKGSRLPVDSGTPVDAAVRLERNHNNGMVEPRLVLRHAVSPAHGPIDVLGEPACFEHGVRAELARALAGWDAPHFAARAGGGARTVVDRCREGVSGLLASLVHAGEPVLAVAAHAGYRANGLRDRVGGFALASYAALEDAPELAEDHAHVVLIDPPDHPALQALAEQLPGRGWTHLAWGAAELAFAQRILEWNYDLRPQLASVYRALRAAGGARGAACEALLCGEGPQPRSARLSGRLLRVLTELGLVTITREEPLELGVPDAPSRTELERSSAFRAYTRRLEDGRRFLTSSTARAAA